MTLLDPAEPLSWASSSTLDDLPSLAVLQTWVHRPAALAKCTISDVYQMRTLAKRVDEGVAIGYATRDVFMLNRFPCRMVELVGWVAGIDEKEKSQTVYLDDGDGRHVLQLTVKLPLAAPAFPTKPSATYASSTKSQPHTQTQRSDCFLPAKARNSLRKAAIEQSSVQAKARTSTSTSTLLPAKVYARNDIRVGDIVRIRGRIDEWRRGTEWIRQVAVEPGAGGSISVVDPEQQYLHLEQVIGLHGSLYSRPFSMPPLPLPASAQTQTQSWDQSADTTIASLDSTMPSSEIGSEASVDFEQVKLCKPSKLRPSQLTDRTFRQYLLDYMTQETIRQVETVGLSGPDAVRQALQEIFPEYRTLWSVSSSYTPKADSTPRRPFAPRQTQVQSQDLYEDLTPRPSRARPGSQMIKSASRIDGFTIPSLLSVSHLDELADLVVEEQSRKEEKRRRRRLRDGTATQKDLDSQSQSQSQSGKKDWRLTPSEKRARMERLVKWVIRGLSEEGLLVQVQSQRSNTTFDTDQNTPPDPESMYTRERTKIEYAYIPLPESLLLPMLMPHITAEMGIRAKIFLRRTDSRHGSGILLEEVLGRLRRCGEDGRWERVGDWAVEDALVWGEARGEVTKLGKGWAVGGK